MRGLWVKELMSLWTVMFCTVEQQSSVWTCIQLTAIERRRACICSCRRNWWGALETWNLVIFASDVYLHVMLLLLPKTCSSVAVQVLWILLLPLLLFFCYFFFFSCSPILQYLYISAKSLISNTKAVCTCGSVLRVCKFRPTINSNL